MNNIIFKLECLDTKNEQNAELFKKLNCDKRDIIKNIEKFKCINKEMLDFLNLSIDIDMKKDTIRLHSDKYVGSVPTRLPSNGLQGGDIQVYPRFFKSNKLSDLCKLLSVLSYSIEPEVITNKLLLKNAEQMTMPLYHEACKYVDIFFNSLHTTWHKFNKIKRKSNYPKSSTNWNEYAKQSYDVNQRLKFSVNDSVLISNHKEYQQLKYVFNCCSNIILNNNTPIDIRYSYSGKINQINTLSYNLKPCYTDKINVHSSDPPIIKKLKQLGNIIINKKSNVNYPWRIDCSILFEKYVQYIIKLATKEIGAISKCNTHINGYGGPSWTLKYLEPDVIINLDDLTIMGDAKYKAYFINNSTNLDFKNDFRLDLHQLLAYCSFIKSNNKIGLIFCPSVNKFDYEKINYHYSNTGVDNTIMIVRIPFDVNEIDENKKMLKDLLTKIQNDFVN